MCSRSLLLPQHGPCHTCQAAVRWLRLSCTEGNSLATITLPSFLSTLICHPATERLDNDVSSTAMLHISDSDHRRLEVTIFPDCIVESHQISDVALGLRRVHITKLWRTERVLGHGTFGEVLLQALDNDIEKKRALKVIRGVKMTQDECQRVLTAMIEFTKPRVLWRNPDALLCRAIANGEDSTKKLLFLLNFLVGSRIQTITQCIWLWNICLVETSRRTF
jgi:hypothetical protein